jgi:hypothetical protein
MIYLLYCWKEAALKINHAFSFNILPFFLFPKVKYSAGIFDVNEKEGGMNIIQPWPFQWPKKVINLDRCKKWIRKKMGNDEWKMTEWIKREEKWLKNGKLN